VIIEICDDLPGLIYQRFNIPETEVESVLRPARMALAKLADRRRILDETLRPRRPINRDGSSPPPRMDALTGPVVSHGYTFEATDQRRQVAAGPGPGWNPAAMPYSMDHQGDGMAGPVLPQGYAQQMPQYPRAPPVSTVGTPRSVDAAMTLQGLGAPDHVPGFQSHPYPTITTTVGMVQPQLAYSQHHNPYFHTGLPNYGPAQTNFPQQSSQRNPLQRPLQSASQPPLRPSAGPGSVSPAPGNNHGTVPIQGQHEMIVHTSTPEASVGRTSNYAPQGMSSFNMTGSSSFSAEFSTSEQPDCKVVWKA
jgi:hypothetical protein